MTVAARHRVVASSRRAVLAACIVCWVSSASAFAQAPRLAPHIEAMRERIAQALDVPADRVNVKAKTAEKLGPVGEGHGIEARAIVLLLAA